MIIWCIVAIGWGVLIYHVVDIIPVSNLAKALIVIVVTLILIAIVSAISKNEKD